MNSARRNWRNLLDKRSCDSSSPWRIPASSRYAFHVLPSSTAFAKSLSRGSQKFKCRAGHY
jgi:hypothetical protein